MYKYSAFKEEINNDLGHYTAYGIEIIDENCKIDKISDVSFDKASLEELCDRLNRLDVSLSDLPELLEDFFAQI